MGPPFPREHPYLLGFGSAKMIRMKKLVRSGLIVLDHVYLDWAKPMGSGVCFSMDMRLNFVSLRQLLIYLQTCSYINFIVKQAAPNSE